MIINGHLLPDRLIACLENRELHRVVGSWPLAEVDGYGNSFESELGQLFDTAQEILEETLRLPEHFAETVEADPYDCSDQPGVIDHIVDFSSIVALGLSGDGAPFCLDYRDNPACPSVIWWDDCYWRRIAPSFEAFLGLLRR